MPSVLTASVEERRYLNGTFAELCRIESPSWHERPCAERVIAELRGLGVEVLEDDTGSSTGSDCGNLLARVPTAQTGAPSVLLCAHMDTVPLAAPVEPVLVQDGWENHNEGILGADNKAAVAVILALARRAVREGCEANLELLFTVGEEVGLLGANTFDLSGLHSEFGYAFDHASPIGEIVLAAPSHFRLEASFHGAAAHAGVRPETGRSAILAAAHAIASMPHGRLDEGTTANVGTIAGGSAMNVVAEHCALVAEVRALSDERAEQVVAELVDRVHEAANLPGCECDVEVSVQRSFSAFRLGPEMPVVRAAEAALAAAGYQAKPISSGGGSDANALIERGLTVLNLANGTERNHEPGERVSVASLEGMLNVALALPAAVAAQSRPLTR